MMSVTLVLVVQATLFADGGITALGTNTLLMAVIGTAAGWAVTRGVQRALGGRLADTRYAPLAGGVGALVSVPASALAFVALFAFGGTATVPLGELTASMRSVHALIGLGEGLITALVLALVLAVAPGVARIDARRQSAAALVHAPVGRAVGALSGIAAVSAVVLSSFAAAAPDGLEATAAELGFLDVAGPHALAALPLADYGATSGSPVGVAGLLGTVMVAALSTVLLAAVRERVAAPVTVRSGSDARAR